MKEAVEAYLAVRRAAGFSLLNADYLLHSFARFAEARGEHYIRTTTAIAWASLTRSATQRAERLQTVCRFARYLQVEEQQHEVPPANHFGAHKTRRAPFIYSSQQITHLIEATSQLGPPAAHAPQTYATLLALLAATGMRVSEALALQVADLTPEGVLIRKTKFQKTRLVPLHESALAGLQRYVQRRPLRASDDLVFVTERGQPLTYPAVHHTFQKLLRRAGLWPASLPHRPRLHDLRHTFAVRALERSPTGRRRIGQHMVALATYLGHVNIYSTYWYLETTPDLLREIATLGETFLYGEHYDTTRPPHRSLPPRVSRRAAKR